MDTVTVAVPVSREVAEALAADPARLARVARVVEQMVRPAPPDADPLAAIIADIKADARADGLTDADIDAELAAWRAERRAAAAHRP